MSNINRTSSPPKLFALLAGAALLGLVSQSVFAAGTLSSTTISNLATLTYAVGAVTQPVIESSPAGNSTSGAGNGTTTTFVVDNKVNLTVAESGATFTPVSPGATLQVTTFTVTNNGNTAQGYNLAGANAAGTPTVFTVADTINVTVTGVFVDANGNGTYESATDTATAISSLAPDATIKVFVVATIPAAINGDQAVVTLTATTTTDGTTTPVVETGAATAGVDIVFADAANVISDPLAANTARDAIGIAQDAYRVAAAIISVSKTVAPVCDPFNSTTNPKNIPGAVVKWTITISNAAGGASANLATIADAISASTTLDPDLITGAGGAAGCEFAAAGAGTAESLNTRSVRIQPSVARAMLGTAGGLAATSSYFVADAADANADGVSSTGGVSINFATAFPALAPYAAGELKPGESIIIYFNVGIN